MKEAKDAQILYYVGSEVISRERANVPFSDKSISDLASDFATGEIMLLNDSTEYGLIHLRDIPLLSFFLDFGTRLNDMHRGKLKETEIMCMYQTYHLTLKRKNSTVEIKSFGSATKGATFKLSSLRYNVILAMARLWKDLEYFYPELLKCPDHDAWQKQFMRGF